MKVDVLVFAAHPDDAELGCSGTIASLVKEGKKVGMIDITKGELGTRGTPQLREKEAKEAADILGVAVRENAGIPDGNIENTKGNQLKLIRLIRRYRPDIVLCNAPYDRHPDHGHASTLVSESVFYSGLVKISTRDDGKEQQAWRPSYVYHYIQDRAITPDIVVDITKYWDIKEASIYAYKSQFYNPDNDEPETYISSRHFMDFIKSRAQTAGHIIGADYGEGFVAARTPGIKSLYDLI